MARRTAPVAPGDLVEVDIDSLESRGSGVGRYEGFVLFVKRGLPGDRVKARVGKVNRSHAQAAMEEVITPGPARIEAPCPFHATCGGCAWQALDYPAQLAAKAGHVRELLERIGKIENPPVREPVAAVSTTGYRNKMEYTFGTGPDGEVVLGMHELGRWDSVVGVDPCLIADPAGVPAHRTVLAWARRNELTAYDKETVGMQPQVDGDGKEIPAEEGRPNTHQGGLLRNLIVRVGRRTGQVLVHLVVTDHDVPKLAELVDDLETEVPGLASVMWSVNDLRNDGSRHEDPVIVSGGEWFEEEIAGVQLRVRPDSFLQPNTEMADRLYKIAIDAAELREDDVLWDIYSGIGSISLAAAPHVRSVLGVEVIEEAVLSAQENAAANGITNARFRVGNARPELKWMLQDEEHPDVIIVDPPRSGLVPKVIRRICEADPRRVVYVSCNPATFASDLTRFAEFGFTLESVTPVDQFPHTPHIELVGVLDPA